MVNGHRQYRRRQKQRAIGRRRKIAGLMGAAAVDSVGTQYSVHAPTYVHASFGVGSIGAGAVGVGSDSLVRDGLNAWQCRSEPQCGGIQGPPPLGGKLFFDAPSPVYSEDLRCAGVGNPPTCVWAPEQPPPSPRMVVPSFSGFLPVTMSDSCSSTVAAQQQQSHNLQLKYNGSVNPTQCYFYGHDK